MKNRGMANLFGRTRMMDEARLVPTGDTIGSYTSYLDAQKAVDYLADQNFPVQHVSIVGNDLKIVERVTGKLSYPRVALNGALTGGWFGLFIGVLLSFFDGNASGLPYLNVATAILLGAAFWMLFAIIGYAAQRGKRDFTSTNQVLASSYDVIVTPDVAMDARRLLAQLPMKSTAAPANGQGYRPPVQPPVQGGYQGGAAGNAPQRPEGWVDPYGPPASPTTPAQPAAGAPAQTGVESAERPGQAPLDGPKRGQFPDLPDGRPQYGIRTQAPVQAPAAEPVPVAPESSTNPPAPTKEAEE